MGQIVGDVQITEIAKLVQTVRRKKVKIAMLAVPAAAAQSVADLLVEAGVTAILNFAPAQLTVPEGVKVQNVDLSVLLKTLSYHTVRTTRSGPPRTDPRTPSPS
jgi:redox-sensing transcriptional repressor